MNAQTACKVRSKPLIVWEMQIKQDNAINTLIWLK